jgi:hypothetical protein
LKIREDAGTGAAGLMPPLAERPLQAAASAALKGAEVAAAPTLTDAWAVTIVLALPVSVTAQLELLKPFGLAGMHGRKATGGKTATPGAP